MARTAKWREKMETEKEQVQSSDVPKPQAKAVGVTIGDVFRHRAEAEHYCVIRVVDGEVHYCTEKGGQWTMIRGLPYFELKKKTRAMPLANAGGLVVEGTWIPVDNIKSRWEND